MGVVPWLSMTASACSTAKSKGASWNAATSAMLAELQETFGGCHLNSRTIVLIAVGVRAEDLMLPTKEIPSSSASRLVMIDVVPLVICGTCSVLIHSTTVKEICLQKGAPSVLFRSAS